MFSLPTLSIGDVQMVAGPLPDRAGLDSLVRSIEGIRGVERVVIDDFDGSQSQLTAHLSRPTPFAGELRAVLHRNLASCTVVDGRLVLGIAGAFDPLAPRQPPAGGAGAGRSATATPPLSTTPSGPDPTSPVASLSLFSDPVTQGAAIAAMNAVPGISVLTFDRELRFTGAVGGVHTAMGRGIELIRGRRAGEVVRPETWALVERGYETAVRGGSTTIDFPGADGALYEAGFSPLLHEGAVVGGMVVLRDVTEQRRDRRLLDELTDVLRVTFDRSPIGHALLSPTGRWVRVNGVLLETLGRTEPQMVTARFHDVTHPDDLAEELRLLAELTAGKRDHYVLSKRFLHADGHDVPVLVTATLLRGTDGTPHGIVAQVTPAPD